MISEQRIFEFCEWEMDQPVENRDRDEWWKSAVAAGFGDFTPADFRRAGHLLRSMGEAQFAEAEALRNELLRRQCRDLGISVVIGGKGNPE